MRTDSRLSLGQSPRPLIGARTECCTCFAILRKCFAIAAVALLAGCNRSVRYPVTGNVSVNGEKPDSGRVFLVPVEGVKGPRVTAQITNGEYKFVSDGGLAPGKYRVELEALKKTGRKTKARLVGGEMAEVDETQQLAPPAYRSTESPLTVDVPGANGGKIDISVASK